MRHGLQLASFRFAHCVIGCFIYKFRGVITCTELWVICNALWAHMAGGNFHHFTKGTGSHLAQPWWQANACHQCCARRLWKSHQWNPPIPTKVNQAVNKKDVLEKLRPWVFGISTQVNSNKIFMGVMFDNYGDHSDCIMITYFSLPLDIIIVQ